MMGYTGADTLSGSTQADLILGGGGNDFLAGGKSDDTLVGGSGVDTYAFNSGDGADTIVDSGTNRILFNNKEVAGTFVKQADGSYKALDGGGARITIGSGGAVMQLDADTSAANDPTWRMAA